MLLGMVATTAPEIPTKGRARVTTNAEARMGKPIKLSEEQLKEKGMIPK